jgi:polysaccharide pyruvyl transferase CsaB
VKLVVSGYYGYGNAGDEAVLAGMLRTLRDHDRDLEFTVLSGDPDHTRHMHDVEAVDRSAPLAVARSLRGADGLVSGGGSLLQDRTSIRPIFYYGGVMRMARWLGRPYVMHAQGLGPIRRGINRRLAAEALRHARHVSLRDRPSIDLARSLGVHRRIDLVPDPALALQAAPRRGGGHLLVAVRAWDSPVPFLGPLRNALAALSDEMRIVALPMHGSVDLEPSREVVAGLPNAEVLDPDSTLQEQLAAIGSARLVLGMRLHAVILAAGAGVPALAFSYDPKVDAFAAQVGQPVIGHVGEPINAQRLLDIAKTTLSADLRPYLDRVKQLRAQLSSGAATTLAAFGDTRERQPRE